MDAEVHEERNASIYTQGKGQGKGLEMRCAELGIDASDKVAVRQRWKEIVDIGLKLPTLEEVTMEDQITLDLETGSVQGSISALRALGESMAGRNVDERNTKARALVLHCAEQKMGSGGPL